MYAGKIFAILVVFILSAGFVNHRMMTDGLSAHEESGTAKLAVSPPSVVSPTAARLADPRKQWQTLRKAQNVIADLQKKLKPSLARPVRVEMVRSALRQIAELRQQSGVLELNNEVYLDFLTDPLASFFGEEYRPEKCANYEHIIMRDYEPSSADTELANGASRGAGREPAMVPQNPPIRKAFEVVAAVCR